MFKNTFQQGFLSILYSIGSRPLQIWDKKSTSSAAAAGVPIARGAIGRSRVADRGAARARARRGPRRTTGPGALCAARALEAVRAGAAL